MGRAAIKINRHPSKKDTTCLFLKIMLSRPNIVKGNEEREHRNLEYRKRIKVEENEKFRLGYGKIE
jgi:hypothetical protein